MQHGLCHCESASRVLVTKSNFSGENCVMATSDNGEGSAADDARPTGGSSLSGRRLQDGEDTVVSASEAACALLQGYAL